MSAGLIGCNPPEGCFTCPFPDCKNWYLVTPEENAFNRRGLNGGPVIRTRRGQKNKPCTRRG